MRLARITLCAAVAATGCSGILGIEDWRDPVLTGGSAGAGGGGGDGGSGGSAPAATGGACDPESEGGPTCNDCLQNGPETDVDCGGDACGPCASGQKCGSDADCSTLHCQDGTCGAAPPNPCQRGLDPTCADCVMNGVETDVDCGGDACPPCAVGQACALAYDCESLACAGGECI